MISIIICSINQKKFSGITQNYTNLMGCEPFEIIGIHDAKSLCEGYNRGIRQSVGDILIFSHDDIEILSPDFVTRLKTHLKNFDVVGFAGARKVLDACWASAGAPFLFGQVAYPYESGYRVDFIDHGKTAHQGKLATDGIQMLDGLFLATKRSVVNQVSFDDYNFDGFHCYDADFTYSAYLAGFSLAVCNDIAVIHYSKGKFDAVFQKYNQRFVAKYAATIDATLPRALRPEGQTVGCADKESILNCYLPETQNRLYEYFSVSFIEHPDNLPSASAQIKIIPIHDHNIDLLNLIPLAARSVIEVGCNSGDLARAYRALNPACEYIGTEIDPHNTNAAQLHCTQIIVGNIEQMLEEIQTSHGAFDCWIFGNILEHLYDPWRVLKHIAQDLLTPGGSVIACIPNMQHWSMQFALNAGNLRYQNAGLLDRKHIRWFTKLTIIEMFQQAGLQVTNLGGLSFEEPERDKFLPLLRDLAEASGADHEQAVADAIPVQWLVRATLPNQSH